MSVDHCEGITHLLEVMRCRVAAAELVGRLQAEGFDAALPVIHEVLLAEHEERQSRRVERLRKASRLPTGKRFGTFDLARLPVALSRSLKELARGDFLDRSVNVLAFGLPGTGKTHAACALGHALVEAGRSVLFAPTFRIVQDLLAAKRDLGLHRALRKLDRYELLILDDLGYVQQDPDEMEVLFTLLAERYERRSLLITSNLVFSAWDRIFQNPMTTAAAIDRLVHHSTILEFDVPSYRTAHRDGEAHDADAER